MFFCASPLKRCFIQEVPVPFVWLSQSRHPFLPPFFGKFWVSERNTGKRLLPARKVGSVEAGDSLRTSLPWWCCKPWWWLINYLSLQPYHGTKATKRKTIIWTIHFQAHTCLEGNSISSSLAFTIPENVAPENGWLEDEIPFGMAYFQVLC